MTSPSPPSTPPLTTSTTPTTSNQNAKAKPIPNPRRLLLLTPTSHSLTTIPPLLHTLTGVAVDNPPTAEAATLTDTPSAGPTETETGAETTPTPTTTFAGYTTHPPLHIENKYYTADIPIWVDEIPLSTGTAPTPESTAAQGKEPGAGTTQWKTEFSGPEARVVRDAIGGVMVCIRNPHPPKQDEDAAERNDVKSIKDFLRCIGDVKRLVEEERGDIGFGEVLGVIALVEGSSSSSSSSSSGSKGTPNVDRKRVDDGGDDDDLDTGAEGEPFSVSWWEDQLDEIGLMDFDVVKWDLGAEEDDRRNKYGEYQGMRRIRQILETHDWSEDTDADAEGGALDDDDLEEHLLGLDSSHGFNLEVNELEREMVGLRMAIERGGDESDFEDGDGDVEDEEGDGDDDGDIKVESMEALMLRMQAIKDMSAELPENERKKFAAKAVGDIMKEI